MCCCDQLNSQQIKNPLLDNIRGFVRGIIDGLASVADVRRDEVGLKLMSAAQRRKFDRSR